MRRPLVRTCVAAALLTVGVALAGNLNPPGPPGSTMRPLTELFGSWDRFLSAADGADSCNSSRFHCFTYPNGETSFEAVTDRETGLVWTRSRGVGGVSSYESQRNDCRLGFRPATLYELESIHDPRTADGLPVGHPFQTLFGGTQSHDTMAATWDAENPALQWGLRVTLGATPFSVERVLGVSYGDVWCVRGPVMGSHVF